MAVQASPEIIREMEKEISDTIREIERISEGIRQCMSSVSNWNDEQAAEFNALMHKIAGLTAAPVGTLNESLPKLERLARALDEYNRVKF